REVETGARRLYGQVFFGKPVAEDVKQSVEKDLAKGIRALRARAKFDPYIAGAELSLADCTAFVSLPLVSLATKHAYGRDFLEDIAQLKPYLKMLEERPAFRQVNADRKAATARAKKRATSRSTCGTSSRSRRFSTRSWRCRFSSASPRPPIRPVGGAWRTSSRSPCSRCSPARRSSARACCA